MKARSKEGGKPFLEGKYGDDQFRRTGAWNKIERTIDRRGNRYRELITDEEGNVVRDVDEPLTDHVGRGDAKRKRP